MAYTEADIPAIRKFQEEGVAYLTARTSAILAFDMGLGKTRTFLEALRTVPPTAARNMVLITCMRSSIDVWRVDELPKWFYNVNYKVIVVRGSPTARVKLWETALQTSKEMGADGYVFVICTYAVVRIEEERFKKVLWHTIGFDEAHALKNRKTDTTKAAKRIPGARKWLLSGTPMSEHAPSIWSLLNVIAPKRFPSYWQFVNHFCEFADTPYGREYIGTKDPAALARAISPFVFVRTKMQVADQLPPKTRISVKYQLTGEQRKQYNDMLTELKASVAGKTILAGNDLTKFGLLRQLAVSPKLINPDAPYGAGVEMLSELIEDSDIDERNVVIFTFYRRLIPILRERLSKMVKAVPIYELHGGFKGNVSDVLQEFKKTKGILLCSIRFAESFSIDWCSTGYVLGADWSYRYMMQAEDRIHRLSSPLPVTLKYLFAERTVDERFNQALSAKMSAWYDVLINLNELQPYLQPV